MGPGLVLEFGLKSYKIQIKKKGCSILSETFLKKPFKEGLTWCKERAGIPLGKTRWTIRLYLVWLGDIADSFSAPWKNLSICRICVGFHRHDLPVLCFEWRRKWQPTPVFLPGESYGQRSLVGYSPWGHKESDKTERLNHHHSALRAWIQLTQGGKAGFWAAWGIWS